MAAEISSDQRVAIVPAIDIDTDQLIAIPDIPAYLKKRTGKKTHIASIYRWVSIGLKGVKLTTTAIGATRYTTPAQLNLFFARIAEAKQARHANDVKTGMRRAQIARETQIEREAEELGI
jgi:hypothetical protein